MTDLWERCRRRDASLNEIVAAFEAEGDVSELVAVARREEDRRSALYVVAELPTETSRPVWKFALDYVADPDDRTAFYALDILHSFLGEVGAHEFLLVLKSTRLASTVLFVKLFAIMLSAPESLLRRSLELSREEMLAGHSEGLARLVSGVRTPAAEVRSMLKQPRLVTRFYGCCLVGRHYSQDKSLRSLLPERVERRLALHEE
ncbi:MAG TPA: hypothetical protein VEA61_08090 [Allosphingosinicella sp.]|nr:hypothetical protein [Allosphingosinicella sp.]